MKASEYFRGVYTSVGKERFVNQAHFISLLFNAAGSSYFKIEPTRKYGSDAYQFKIFNGSKKISKDIRNSFPKPIERDNLINFFEEYIDEKNAKLVSDAFEIKHSNNLDVEKIVRVLAEQFELFIINLTDDVDDIMDKNYNLQVLGSGDKRFVSNNLTVVCEQKWKYTVVLLDDMEEQLEMLKDEMKSLFNQENRYEVRIFALKNSVDVILESHNMDVDVYVLDVARKSSHKWQTSEYDYFGYDLYKQIVTEKPNVLVKSKFYIYSRLPMSTINEEFNGAEICFLQKQKHSTAEVSKIVKKHIDLIYEKESKTL